METKRYTTTITHTDGTETTMSANVLGEALPATSRIDRAAMASIRTSLAYYGTATLTGPGAFRLTVTDRRF